MKKIYNFLTPALLITSIILIYQLYSLPNKISEALNLPDKDTITITVADKLKVKNDMVYFSGELTSKQNQISEKYNYNPDYPKEFWDGWLTLAISDGGGKYFIWSSKKIDNIKKIDGWFVISNGNWQNEKDYLQVLIPIVSRN